MVSAFDAYQQKLAADRRRQAFAPPSSDTTDPSNLDNSADLQVSPSSQSAGLLEDLSADSFPVPTSSEIISLTSHAVHQKRVPIVTKNTYEELRELGESLGFVPPKRGIFERLTFKPNKSIALEADDIESFRTDPRMAGFFNMLGLAGWHTFQDRPFPDEKTAKFYVQIAYSYNSVPFNDPLHTLGQGEGIDRILAKKEFSIQRLLASSLSSFPTTDRQEKLLLRGDISSENKPPFKKGQVIFFPQFASASENLEIAEGFANNRETGLIFVIRTQYGSYGSGGTPIGTTALLAHEADEKEVLFGPFSRFKVEGVYQPGEFELPVKRHGMSYEIPINYKTIALKHLGL